MAVGPKELQRRALREAQAFKSSDGIAEGREVPDSGNHQSASLKSLCSRRGMTDSRTCGAQAASIKPSPSEAKKGRPRIEVAHKTLAATKPWAALGMSERTWFRRQAERKVK